MGTDTDRYSKARVEDLLAFSAGIMNGENGKELIERYKTSIENLTPHDMLVMEEEQLKMGISPEMIKKNIGKIINTFYKALSSYDWKKPSEGEFLYYLMKENRALEDKLAGIKKNLKEFNSEDIHSKGSARAKLQSGFIELLKFNDHYLKKENILFPYLEKYWDNYLPLKVMWSLHDDIRKKLKEILSLLQDRWSSPEDLNREIGSYFFLAYGMIFKEDLIIFPVAYETIAEKYWEEMHIKSFEFSFPFIDPPERPQVVIKDSSQDTGKFLHTDTGTLNSEQIEIILNNLPLDITVVDENDRVAYFTRSGERIFPRSSAIIGRKVQNCHPPESVDIVEKIISSFRKGEKDNAVFWITVRDRKLLIRYDAMRNDKGEYRGVLETVQDITDIQTMEGEKRLLDWN